MDDILFKSFLVPMIIFITSVIFSLWHWKKSTAYFKISFLCWLVSFWGIVFWAVAAIEQSKSSTAALGYIFLPGVAVFYSLVIWLSVWMIGFLIAKITAYVSNRQKQKRYKY